MASYTFGVPRLSEEDRKALQMVFREKLGNLVFRRVGKVFTKGLKRALHYEFDVSESKARAKVCRKIPKDQEVVRKEWELHFGSFYGFAEPAGRRGLRDTDPSPEEEVYFSSANYAELDLIKGCTFKFNKSFRQEVRPMPGDLICGIMEKTGRKPQFTCWFNCSEQFFRAWTLLMYKHHESYKGKSEDRLKNFSLSGNRLNTNTFLKWMMALKDNHQPIPQEEADKRYYHLRTEYVSVNWIHTYPALVLMARWGELPCRYNIPNNRDNGLKMNHWNLPGHFITTLLKEWTQVSPKDWDHETWKDLEQLARKRRAVYKTPKKKFQAQCTEFPSLSTAPTPEAKWVIKSPVEDDIFTLLSKSAREDSWADMVEEEEDRKRDLTDSRSGTDGSPSEGGDRKFVYLLYSKEKEDSPPTLMELVDSVEKAKKYLTDWVSNQTESGHLGDGQQRQHSQESASLCELCQLRKYKAAHNDLDDWWKVELWNGTIGYAEEKEVL